MRNATAQRLNPQVITQAAWAATSRARIHVSFYGAYERLLAAGTPDSAVMFDNAIESGVLVPGTLRSGFSPGGCHT
jgi:hypothetical protein